MILSQKILDDIAKEAVVYRSNFNAYKYKPTDRCGFYNCIAGMHHPTCPNYTGILIEITLQDFNKEPEYCYADSDGDCEHINCPQLRDGEPKATGRHCPLDLDMDEDW